MCETEGAHITGKQPYILEDFTREDAILTRPPPPCSRARRAAESKLKRVHKIELVVRERVYYALNIK